MAAREYGGYKVDPLSLSAEDNEQVADLMEENNALIYEVPVVPRTRAPSDNTLRCIITAAVEQGCRAHVS